ncbi:MAG: hypothetical protein PVF37_02815 [Desulfobacterales bacterium]
MQIRFQLLFRLTALSLLSLAFGLGHVQAEEKRDMKGWGIDDPYNKLYDVREFEKVRAWVVRVKEVIPMPGMSPATALEVREGAYVHEVHLCPTWYRKPSEGCLGGDRRQRCFYCLKNKKRSEHRNY